jgi:predicted Zn-dependent peptidase
VAYVKDLEQTQWTLGFPGIPQGDPHFYPSAVLATLLGGGMSSRLFQEVREKHGLAYSIYAYHSCYQDTGIFGIYASTQPNHTLKLTQTVKDLLVQLPDSLTPQEIDRAKAQMKAGTLMGLENTNSRAERCAQQLHILGRIMDNQETIDRIDAVSLSDLQSYAHQVFSGTPTCVTLGPTDQSEKLQKILG